MNHPTSIVTFRGNSVRALKRLCAVAIFAAFPLVTNSQHYSSDAPGNCGTLALYKLALELNRTQVGVDKILMAAAPERGFSLALLQNFSDQYHLGLVAVQRSLTQDLVVPSVVHLRWNHYVTLLKQEGGLYQVYDPQTGNVCAWDANSLLAIASGYFLIPRAQSEGSRILSQNEAARVQGRGYPTTIDDGADLYLKSGGGPGLPTWHVSEPFLSLWIQFPVLQYTTSAGKQVSLEVAYKQRAPSGLPNVYCFGPNWQCTWSSSVQYAVEQNETTHQWYIDDSSVQYFAPLGGTLAYVDDGSTPEYNTYSKLSHSGISLCGATFYANYPDGSELVYGQPAWCRTAFVQAYMSNYLSQITDPQGRSLTLNYNTNGGNVLLVSMVDYDNRTNLFYYDSTFTSQISSVVDAYNRTNKFQYDSHGRLTNIINSIGMNIGFLYDQAGVITNMISLYGTNAFQYTVNTNTGNLVNRSMQVTEPDGRTHLFIYRDQSTYLNTNGTTPLMPFSYSSTQMPSTLSFSNTFDNTWMDARDSFYWSPRCYSQLSTNFLQTQNFNNLTTNDYFLAWMKHWQLENNSSSVLGNTASLIRQPSPDGVLEGQKLWLDYAGKQAATGTNLSGQTITNYYSNGTNDHPSFTAIVLPDSTSRFSYASYNAWGFPLQIVTTYSGGSGVATRTNNFNYGTNGIDLGQIIGTAGEVLSSNVFNSAHLVATNYDALNQKTVIAYNSLNQVSSIVAPTGLTVSNAYFGSGTYSNFLQSAVVLGINATNSFTYTNGLLYTHTDPRGVTTTTIWDKLKRPTQASGPNGTITYTYTNLSVVQVVNQMNHTNCFGYDSTGKNIWRCDALQRTNWYSYYPWGGLQAVTNALGQSTSWTYDNLNRVLVTTMPDLAKATNVYNIPGQLISVFDPAGKGLSYTYNNAGLVTAISNALGAVMLNTYDIKDRVTAAINASGLTNSFTYDVLNRILTQTSGDGGVEHFAYNAFGLYAYTNQINQFLHNGYDVAGRVITQTNANNEYIQFFYDVSGNVTNLIDGKGQSTKWNYDSFGRVTNKVDATGTTILAYSYDIEHKLTNRWSAAKGNTAYSYDAVGNLKTVTYSNSPSINFIYDPLNRVTNMVDAVGTSQFQYTSFGALSSEDGPWNDDTVTYAYTTDHLLASLSLLQQNASPWVQSIGYDAANRVQSITSPAGVFGYGYKLAGTLVTSLTLPTGSFITNTYDYVGRLTGTWFKSNVGSILDSDTYTFDLAGQITNHIRADGSYVNYTFDNIGQLKAATGFESGGTIRPHENFGFTYDSAGNVNFRTNNALTQTFNLNNLNQLTTITRSGTLTVAGTTTSTATNVTVSGTGWSGSASASLYHDNTWARTNATLIDGANSFTAAAQDSYGRGDTNTVTVTLPATVTFTYDLNGNLTSDGTRGFDYDDDNQLIRITVTNSWKSEFTYDGMGRRRIRTEYTWQNSSWVPTNQVRYVCSGNLVIQERDTNNLALTSYTRGLDLSGSFDQAGGTGGLLARTDAASGQHYYYRSDGSGNITSLENAQQSLVAKYLYDPFGNILSKCGLLADVNLYRFASKEAHVNSGLYYFGARFYDPNFQRWLNRDPLGEAGGINLYAFAGNASVNAIDPWGFWTLEEWQPEGGGGDGWGGGDWWSENPWGSDPGAGDQNSPDQSGDNPDSNGPDGRPSPPPTPFTKFSAMTLPGQMLRPEFLPPGPPLQTLTPSGNPLSSPPPPGQDSMPGPFSFVSAPGGFNPNQVGNGGGLGRGLGGTVFGSLGAPHGIVAIIPVLGNTLNFLNDIQTGHPYMAAFHGVMAVSDVFLVKSITVGVAKAGVSLILKLGAQDVGRVGAEAAVEAAAKEGTHLVYQGVDKAGVVRYVGITERGVAVRAAEHIAAGEGKEFLNYYVVQGAENLSRTQARIIEQKLINQYGLGKNGGQLLNKINSIRQSNWDIYGIGP